jgi:hypothetical protein
VGFAISVPALIQGRLAAGALGFAIGSLAFGLVYYLLGRSTQRRLLEFGDLPERLPVRPVLLLRVDRPVDAVLQLVEQSMNELFGKAARSGSGAAELRVTAVTSRCWWKAIGEQVDVLVAPETDSVSTVAIVSRPRLSSVILDGGRNYVNARRLQHALAESAGGALVHFVRLDEER